MPLIDGTWELVCSGVAPGGTRRNLSSVDAAASWDESLSEEMKLVLCDAQTSGGLLMSVPPARLSELTAALSRRGVSEPAVIGEMAEGGPHTIEVLP